MSLLFRLQIGLAWSKLPLFLKLLLGKWAPDGVMDPRCLFGFGDHSRYHHGVLCFDCWSEWYIFVTYLFHCKLGPRDMASGLLNMVSYWLFFFLFSVIMVFSLFVEAGPAAAGWTVYPPLKRTCLMPQPGSGTGYDFVVGVYGYLYSFFAFRFS